MIIWQLRFAGTFNIVQTQIVYITVIVVNLFNMRKCKIKFEKKRQLLVKSIICVSFIIWIKFHYALVQYRTLILIDKKMISNRI